MFRYWRRS